MKHLALLFTSACLLSGCVGRDIGGDLPKDVGKVVPSDFFCSATPSEAYGPGFVYRVDQLGSEFLVVDLSSFAKTFKYSAVSPVYEASFSRSGGMIFNLLGTPSTASADVNSVNSGTSRVAFSSGSYVLMSDETFDALLAQIEMQVTPKIGSRYFVVRDTIQASGIDIVISREDKTKIGGEAKVAKIIGATPSVDIQQKESLSLVKEFQGNLNVCKRPVEIQPSGKVSSGGSIEPVSEEIGWRVSKSVVSEREVSLIFSK
jgi:hypothetical protein